MNALQFVKTLVRNLHEKHYTLELVWTMHELRGYFSPSSLRQRLEIGYTDHIWGKTKVSVSPVCCPVRMFVGRMDLSLEGTRGPGLCRADNAVVTCAELEEKCRGCSGSLGLEAAPLPPATSCWGTDTPRMGPW